MTLHPFNHKTIDDVGASISVQISMTNSYTIMSMVMIEIVDFSRQIHESKTALAWLVHYMSKIAQYSLPCVVGHASVQPGFWHPGQTLTGNWLPQLPLALYGRI